MFYITNTRSYRTPYRVEEIGEEQGDRRQSQQDHDSEAEEHEKFLKASQKLYKQRSVILARSIMNKKILPLKCSLSLEEALELTQKHQFEYFPIISEEGKLMGLLSEKEILQKVQKQEGKKTLKEAIGERTLCADADTNLQEIIQVFFHESVEAVPIVDQDQKVIGMLSRNDLLYTILKISNLRDRL